MSNEGKETKMEQEETHLVNDEYDSHNHNEQMNLGTSAQRVEVPRKSIL